MEEEWRPLVGFEKCYAISDLGRVARVMTYGKNPKPMWRLLARRVKKSGYLTYHLCKDGVRTDPLAHRLVWRTFCGEIPDGFEINHINSMRNDASLANLEPMTRSQNAAYAFSHNARAAPNNPSKGSLNGGSKLIEDDIVPIRAMLADGCQPSDLATLYGVTRECIYAIQHRKTWRHI